MVTLIELYPFIPLSMIFIAFQGHGGLKQDETKVVYPLKKPQTKADVN